MTNQFKKKGLIPSLEDEKGKPHAEYTAAYAKDQFYFRRKSGDLTSHANLTAAN